MPKAKSKPEVEEVAIAETVAGDVTVEETPKAAPKAAPKRKPGVCIKCGKVIEIGKESAVFLPDKAYHKGACPK